MKRAYERLKSCLKRGGLLWRQKIAFVGELVLYLAIASVCSRKTNANCFCSQEESLVSHYLVKSERTLKKNTQISSGLMHGTTK